MGGTLSSWGNLVKGRKEERGLEKRKKEEEINLIDVGGERRLFAKRRRSIFGERALIPSNEKCSPKNAI